MALNEITGTFTWAISVSERRLIGGVFLEELIFSMKTFNQNLFHPMNYICEISKAGNMMVFLVKSMYCALKVLNSKT